MPSGEVASVMVSPPPTTGRTWRVLDLASLCPGAGRDDVNATRRPSGDHRGDPSWCSPLEKGSGGVEPLTAASHTWLR